VDSSHVSGQEELKREGRMATGARREQKNDRRQWLPRNLEFPALGATATASGGRGSREGGEVAMGGGDLRMVERRLGIWPADQRSSAWFVSVSWPMEEERKMGEKAR
jgi:hypothetical protein